MCCLMTPRNLTTAAPPLLFQVGQPLMATLPLPLPLPLHPDPNPNPDPDPNPNPNPNPGWSAGHGIHAYIHTSRLAGRLWQDCHFAPRPRSRSQRLDAPRCSRHHERQARDPCGDISLWRSLWARACMHACMCTGHAPCGDPCGLRGPVHVCMHACARGMILVAILVVILVGPCMYACMHVHGA